MSTGLPDTNRLDTNKPKIAILTIPKPVNAKAIKQIVSTGTQDIIVPIGQKDICVEVLPTSIVTICSVDANGFKTQPLPL
jgi:hypothetical protein